LKNILNGGLLCAWAGLYVGMTMSEAAPIPVNVPNGTTQTITVQLTGPNSLIMNTNHATTGTLVLTGNGPGAGAGIGNNYTGSTMIEGGTLRAGTGSGSGNALSPNSDFILSGANSTLDINGNNETIASLASNNATTVVTNSANGSATLTINDANSSLTAPAVYEFDGTLTDAGVGNSLALVKQGPGALILTNANTFHGGTTITGGTIVAANTAALGNGSVLNGGTLETSASLGGSVQLVAVGGNYTQTAGGTLLLQVVSSPSAVPFIESGVAGVNYDTVTVAGAAAPGGTLDLNFGGGSVPSQGQRFDVLTAGAPLASEFNFPTTTNLPAPFYTVTTYNDTFGGIGGSEPANSVVVTLIKPFATSYPILSPNQTSVARGIDTTLTILNNSGALAMPGGTNKDFFDNIITGLNIATYEPGGLASALDQLSAQRLEVLRNVAFDNFAMDVQSLDDEFARERYSRGGIDTSGFAVNDSALGFQLSEVKSRLLAWNPPSPAGLLSDSSQASLGGMEMSDTGDTKRMVPQLSLNKWNAFIDGGADFGDLDSNIDGNHSSYTSGRVRIGADYLVSPNFRFGALFGYSHSDVDLDNEGSSATVDTYTPGIFATYADKNGFYANALVTGGLNEYDTDRKIIIPGVDRTARGSASGEQYGGDIDGGYEFHKGAWTFGPSAGLTYLHLGIDDFNETGAGAANLSVNDQSSESLRSRLGGTLRYQGRIGSIILTPHLNAYWQHEFLDGQTYITSQFEGLPGGTFTVQTPEGDNDTALLGLGLDAQITDNVTLFLDYQTEAGGSTFFGQSGTGGVKVAF
jgi:autotransporter-associated beta strand protein